MSSRQDPSSWLAVFLLSPVTLSKTGAGNKMKCWNTYRVLAGSNRGTSLVLAGCQSCPSDAALWWWDQKEVLSSLSSAGVTGLRRVCTLMSCQDFRPWPRQALLRSGSLPPDVPLQVSVPGSPALSSHPRVCSSSLPVCHGHAPADELQ